MYQKGDKAVYIYAGLIFFVAVIIIIIAFFGQEKLDKEAFVQKASQPAASITEKAAALSDENRLLYEKVNELTEQINQQDNKILDLNKQAEELESVKNNIDALIKCYSLCNQKKYEEANTLFSSIDASALSEDAMSLYEDIDKKIAKGLKK